ncbi:MAG: hypothetical protein ACRDGV_12460 [Candidatus Limnocylindria bacterium]
MRWPWRPHPDGRMADATDAADALERALRGEPVDPSTEALAAVARSLDAAAAGAPLSPRADEIRMSMLRRLDDPRKPSVGLTPVLLAGVVAIVLGIGAAAASPAVGDLVPAPVRSFLDGLLGQELGPSELPIPTFPDDADGSTSDDDLVDPPARSPEVEVPLTAPPDAGPPDPMPTPPSQAPRTPPVDPGPPGEGGLPDPMPTPPSQAPRTPPVDPGPPGDDGPP